MLTIGEFARLGQVTVKALRHYDALGLLKPAAIDPESGYRRYTEAQLPRLRRVGELKALGFRLEAIGALLDEPPPPVRWRTLLHDRQSELLREMRLSRATLSRVDREVRQLDDMTSPQEYVVELVELEPVLVAGVRDRIVTGTIYQLFEELRGWLADHGAGEAGPFLTLGYVNSPYQAGMLDAEATVVLDAPLPGNERVQVRELPAVQAARVVHYGDYQQLYRAHEALSRWIDEHGFERMDPGREIYWRAHANTLSTDDFVTEILVPVQKRGAETAEGLPPNVRSFQLPGLTLDYQLFAADPDPRSIQPAYLPAGLVVSRLDARFYAAVDSDRRIVLFWSWNPGIEHVILPRPANAGEPQPPEAHPDGERMRYFLPAGGDEPATVVIVERRTAIWLTSSVFARDELLKIAASFPRAKSDETT
ncbi:MAG: hypothetical protein RLZZ387_5353 [Chloroflexota bacterium]|jgi:DNA-binding transcriptional MerR regulator